MVQSVRGGVLSSRGRDCTCGAVEDMQGTHKTSFMADMLEHTAHYIHVPDLTHTLHIEQLTRARRLSHQSAVAAWQPSLEC